MKMKLDEFIKVLEKDIKKFEKFYSDGFEKSKNNQENWPEELSVADWYDQFTMWYLGDDK